ncbi:MAG: SPOR domain-containing protein [Treponema sp.]|nr:SPOR domain-containing protein [Treponema sp.]
MIRNREGVQGLQSPPSTGTPGDVYVYGEYSGESGAGAKTSGNNATNLVIEVPKPGTPPVGRTESKPQTTASKQPASVASTTPKSTVVKAEPKPQTTTLVKPQQASVASKSPAPAAIKATVQQGKHDNNYWVQTGAFSTQVRAEGVKEILSAKGIAAIIENGDVNGRDVFRVRVGPYTSPNEADYWLTLIRAINGFEDSQVRISQSLR